MDSFASVHKRPDENVCSEIDTHKTYYITLPPPHRYPQDLLIPCSVFTLFRLIGNRLVLKLVS